MKIGGLISNENLTDLWSSTLTKTNWSVVTSIIIKITYKKHGVVLIFFPTKIGKHVSYFFAVMEHRFPVETSAVGIFFSQVKNNIKLYV